MKHLILFAFLATLLVSCKDAEQKAFLAEIDELQQQLLEIEQLAQDHTVDSIGIHVAEINNTLLRIQNNYFPDSIDLEIAGMLNQYKMIRKRLQSNSGNLAKVKAALPEVKEALTHLAHDIEHGVGNRELYGEHVAFERDKVNQMQELIDFYIKGKDDNLSLYLEIGPKVEAFSMELLEKRKSETVNN
jgi:chaperonin cofactor prefoldin